MINSHTFSLFQTFSIRRGLLLFVTASLTLSACATQSERRDPPPERGGERAPKRTSGIFLQPIAAVFAGMDANRDKVISVAELQASITTEWASFNGNPSATTFSQWSLKNLGTTDAAPTFMSFDADFNGVITEVEFSYQFETIFHLMDKDRDGTVERSEMLVVYNAPQGQSSRGGGREGGRRDGGGGGRPPR